MKKINVLKKLLMISIIICGILYMILPSSLSHSGRKDSSGGHKDNKNKSGLGPYHYHCGGNPAHLHDGGVCPYNSSAQTLPKTGSDTVQTSATSVNKKVEAKSITLSEDEVELKINENKTISATVKPSNTEEKELTWSSNNEQIAKVSDGEITAIGVGSCIITVETANGIKKEINVKVNPIQVESIECKTENVELYIGDNKKIIAKALPENSTDKTLKWESSNVDVAEVSNGNIKAKSNGTATIKISSTNGITKEITVTVKEILAECIETDISYISVLLDSEYDIPSVKILPENTTNKDFKYTIKDESIAKIEKGKIKGLKEGKTELTIETNNGISKSIEIEVSEGSLAPLGIMALAGGGYLYYKKKKSKKEE